MWLTITVGKGWTCFRKKLTRFFFHECEFHSVERDGTTVVSGTNVYAHSSTFLENVGKLFLISKNF